MVTPAETAKDMAHTGKSSYMCTLLMAVKFKVFSSRGGTVCL